MVGYVGMLCIFASDPRRTADTLADERTPDPGDIDLLAGDRLAGGGVYDPAGVSAWSAQNAADKARASRGE